MDNNNLPTVVEFNRPAKYKPLKRLGSGACGETVLLYDENMDCHFVAKKYKPVVDVIRFPELYADLQGRFKSEARILFRINHPNIVRVYSYYDYKEKNTAYILMEYIDGENISDYIHENPSALEVIFEKVIDGFAHLEQMSILHRDIRPFNILVDRNGSPKIIDFGFGKTLGELGGDVEKSITLNWWCETPPEFSQSIYDHQTEVYFVGKLFEQIIDKDGLSSFKYARLIKSMCERSRTRRLKSFVEIRSSIITGQFQELEFSNEEMWAYRNFSNAIYECIAEIDSTTSFEHDNERVLISLQILYNSCMLEEEIPGVNKIISVFVRGNFRYFSRKGMRTQYLKDFLDMYRSLPYDKQNIVLENLLAKLDTVTKVAVEPKLDDEIPF